MTSAAMHIARTGLDAQDMRMRVISNNLANVNTTGFKSDRANFETLAYQVVTSPGAQSSSESKYATGLNLGTGVKIQGTARIDTQGDVPADGQQPRHGARRQRLFPGAAPRRYSSATPARAISRAIAGGAAGDERGLSGTARHHRCPPTATSITDRYRRHRDRAACRPDQMRRTLGQIQVASFPNAAGLQNTGDNYLTETAASGAANLGIAGPGWPRQHQARASLEASNVNVVEELVDMIETQRAYEVNSKMITAADDMLKYVNQNHLTWPPAPPPRSASAGHWIEIALGLATLQHSSPRRSCPAMPMRRSSRRRCPRTSRSSSADPVAVGARRAGRPQRSDLPAVSAGYAALYEGSRAQAASAIR